MKRYKAIMLSMLVSAAVFACAGTEVSNDKITIHKYKGLEVAKVEVPEVTEADIDASIESTLQALSTQNEITDRPCQEGDMVVIDYSGKIDGVVFDGGTAEEQTLELGSGQMISGFEEGIVGHNIGETFDINVTFPENYGAADLAGKDAVFTITLHSIAEVITPELTDDYVKQNFAPNTTIEEYREQVRADLELSNQQSTETNLEQELWAALLKQCEVKSFDEDKMAEVKSQIEEQYSSVATSYSMETEDFVEQAFGVTIDEMAKNMITQEYAVELIAEEEEIVLTLEAYEEGLAELAEQYGYSDPAEFESLFGEETLKDVLMQGKVVDVMIEHCKQVEG